MPLAQPNCLKSTCVLLQKSLSIQETLMIVLIVRAEYKDSEAYNLRYRNEECLNIRYINQ